MIKNYLKIIGVSLLLTACQNVFNPNVDNTPPALVVEGYLSTKSEKQTVLLTHSMAFDENSGYYPVETGATVYVTDDQGNRFDYHEYAAGIYRTAMLDYVKGVVGSTYVLHIETKEGNVYESTPQTIKECAQPSQLICKPARKEVLTQDAYGDAVEVFQNGIDIDVSSHGVLPVHNFYQYTWDADIEYLVTIGYEGEGNFNFYQYGKLIDKDRSVIRTGNADGLADHTIRNKKILFITFPDLNDFFSAVLDSDSISYKGHFRGLFFKLQQRSLTPDAYEFWNGAENQLEANGSLFDPEASQIKSNIRCVTDSNKVVYGIFTAYDEKDKYAYFYANSKRAFSEDVDSFPPTLPDTSFPIYPPNGWINPPF